MFEEFLYGTLKIHVLHTPSKRLHIWFLLQPWRYINSAFLKKKTSSTALQTYGTPRRRATGSSFSDSTCILKSWSTSTCPPVLSRQTCGGILLESVSRTGSSRFGGEQGSWGFILATIKVDKLEMIHQKEAPKNIVIIWTYMFSIYQGSPFPCQRFPKQYFDPTRQLAWICIMLAFGN